MPHGAITLAELHATRTVLDVECKRCKLQGRLHVPQLITQHGASLSLVELRRILWDHCPKRKGDPLPSPCSVYLPGLSGNAGNTE